MDFEKIAINGESWTALRLQLGDIILHQVFVNERLKKENPRVDCIYHYTSLSGLISIVENQSIYCSNINFLNDKKEYKYGVEIILSVVEKLKESKNYNNILEKVSEHINLIYKSERYVTCFSKNGDLLSQWRAYANQGKGVSIGFERSNFNESIYQHIIGHHISYDEKYQKEVIEELIRIIIVFFEERKEFIEWADYGYEWLVANAIIENLDNIISTYKHPSFCEEQEFRFEYVIDGNMIEKGDERIFFRPTESLIVPYILLKSEYRLFLENREKGKYDDYGEMPEPIIRNIPIKKIIIGPSLDFESVKLGISELLEKNNYKDVLIERSKIPYRI